MADNKRESSSLKNLLETVYEVHRKDIKTYTSGHLNSSKLLKPPEARHKRWETADKPPIRCVQASHIRLTRNEFIICSNRSLFKCVQCV